MKDKLKELAERWKRYDSLRMCAKELLSILDAEGDGGAVSGVNPDELYAQLTPFADPVCRYCDGRGVFYGNVCVCGCVMTKLQATHPARSGAVSEGNVHVALERFTAFRGEAPIKAMRGALEHFAKGERHE